MPDYPKLTRERFLIMAEQAGFDPVDPHLDDLMPDVQLALGRMAMMFAAPVDGYEPGPFAPGEA